MPDPVCCECGSTDDVLEVGPVWTAWGRNCFDFNWNCDSTPRHFCETCEDQFGLVCNDCGGIVEAFHYGVGYLPENYCGDHICPYCAEKNGFECRVHISRSSTANKE